MILNYKPKLSLRRMIGLLHFGLQYGKETDIIIRWDILGLVRTISKPPASLDSIFVLSATSVARFPNGKTSFVATAACVGSTNSLMSPKLLTTRDIEMDFHILIGQINRHRRWIRSSQACNSVLRPGIRRDDFASRSPS
ncbi:MAG: hypothetical protein IIT36_00230 [Aeriscardovia sp.]|nr:hypothetical protein [Aeriscardovia sp.]